MIYVLDACALLSIIKNEEGASTVRQALEAEDNVCIVHAVNLCEVYYDCLRCCGNEAAEDLLAKLIEAGLSIRSDMDIDFWKAAGSLKARPSGTRSVTLRANSTSPLPLQAVTRGNTPPATVL
jgi:PIN domain nuclease of toxin-antitoxin system